MALLGLYLVACALLVVAGVMKAARPGDTARALVLSLRHPIVSPTTVRIGATAEAVLGAAALAWPARPLAAAVAATYAAFGTYLGYARSRGGSLSTCGCFGEPDTPPTALHLVADSLFLAAAVSVAVASRAWVSLARVLGTQYDHGAPLVAAGAVAAGLAYLALSPLARLQALRATNPPVPTGASLGQAAGR